jgi:hypothetical protein
MRTSSRNWPAIATRRSIGGGTSASTPSGSAIAHVRRGWPCASSSYVQLATRRGSEVELAAPALGQHVEARPRRRARLPPALGRPQRSQRLGLASIPPRRGELQRVPQVDHRRELGADVGDGGRRTERRQHGRRVGEDGVGQRAVGQA